MPLFQTKSRVFNGPYPSFQRQQEPNECSCQIQDKFDLLFHHFVTMLHTVVLKLTIQVDQLPIAGADLRCNATLFQVGAQFLLLVLQALGIAQDVPHRLFKCTPKVVGNITYMAWLAVQRKRSGISLASGRYFVKPKKDLINQGRVQFLRTCRIQDSRFAIPGDF